MKQRNTWRTIAKWKLELMRMKSSTIMDPE